MKMKRGLALLMALCMLIGMMPMVGVSAEEYPAITLDTEQTVTISEEGETAYFAFTPAYSESYMFYSLGDSDTYGYLYDSNMSYLTEDDDEGEDRNFSITYDLEAGQTYILGARFYSSHETGDFSVVLKANHTSSNDGEMVKEPSCTEQGSMNCVCDVCGETYTQAIPTVPHTWDENNTCTVCQYAIPALLTDTETTVIISEGDEIASFSYTPAYTHEYEFYAISDSDTYGSVYDMDMNELACDDDSGDEMNFLICYTLEAGKTYILGAKYLSDEETGTFQVVLKAVHSCSTEGVVTKEPTCTEDGEMICICDVCGDEYTEVIPGGHTWGEDELVCDRCGVEVHEEGTCGDDVTWVLDKTGTLTISGTGQMYDWSSSGAPWYDYQEMIKIVVLEDGVSSIGDYAFYNCSSLNYIIFNGDAPSIHSTAFSGVTATAYYPVDNATWTSDVMQDYGGDITWVAMSDVFVAEGVCGDNLTWNLDNDGVLTISGTGQMSDWSYSDSIPWYDYREMIKTVVLEAGVGSIGDTAFYECSSLTSIDLPDSVTSIGGWAFGYCRSLTSVDLGNSVTSIGDYAFYKCGSLVNIGLPDSVTSIGDYAFYDCSSLTSVDLGNSVTSIGRHAFRYCRSLTSIDLPDSVTSIGDYAFSSCSSLTSIDLPDSVTSIGSGAFSDCSSLTGIYVAENNQNYSNDSYGVLYNKQKTTLIQAPGAISGSYAIPDSVTSIGDHAFYKCGSLVNIGLPDSVTSIGDHAFYKCGSLVNIGLPDSVTSIGDHAFYECSSLTSVDLGNSVTSIGDSAFGYCRSLTSIDLPDSVTSIGGWAFGYCRSLTSVDLGDSVTSIGGGAFYDCSSLTSIELPDSVTSIGYSAFYSCRSLTSVDLGNSVTSIGDDAFSFCSSLTSIDLPDSVTSIGYEAFSSCSSLTSVDLGNSVTYIGSYAFWGCSSLSEIIFTGDVPEIDYDAFAGVTADAYYPAGNATWTSDVMRNYGGNITWVAQYEMLDGDGSVVQMGGTPELEVRAAGEISEFEGVTVDGELVDPSNYTVTEGSTIVTFKPEYLKTLEEGEHTIEIHFTSGVAIAEVSVEKPAGILGDLDLNGLVNSDDLTLLARHVGGIELVDGQALLNADVNGDGKVNSDDLTKHARYVGGIITDWDQD